MAIIIRKSTLPAQQRGLEKAFTKHAAHRICQLSTNGLFINAVKEPGQKERSGLVHDDKVKFALFESIHQGHADVGLGHLLFISLMFDSTLLNAFLDALNCICWVL